jgi:hypothetical protein
LFIVVSIAPANGSSDRWRGDTRSALLGATVNLLTDGAQIRLFVMAITIRLATASASAYGSALA